MFPWQTAASGRDMSFVPPANLLEQHGVADIALNMRQYWCPELTPTPPQWKAHC